MDKPHAALIKGLFLSENLEMKDHMHVLYIQTAERSDSSDVEEIVLYTLH